MNIDTINEQSFPVVISGCDHNDVIQWAVEMRTEFRKLLNKHGAILFRGLDISDLSQFEKFVAGATCGEWVEYREAATPRSRVAGNVFTSTEYPSKETIFYHNENSHTTSWPLYLAFYCQTPASTGGETPLSDCRSIYKMLPEALREKFTLQQVLYRRNFGYGVGIPWQKGFNVSSKAEMETYCREQEMTLQWFDGDKLRISYTRPAVRQHPITGENIWFNHGTFFNFYSSAQETQNLIAEFIGKENAPYNTYFGSGEEISQEVIATLKALYETNAIKLQYQSGDILLIDNMLVAHGRQPFEGDRKVYVSMTNRVRL